MGRITNILFPVAFSSSCIGMGAYVKRVADLFDARVSLLHVFDRASHNGLEMYVRPADEIALEHEELARQKLDAFLQFKLPAPQYSRILASGAVVSEIALTARGGFDLIMMATHAGVFRRMLLVSTTSRVLNEIGCPVITSEHAEVVAPRPMAHREMLCAIGLGENSERVLRYAHQLSREAHANFRILHAIDAGDSMILAEGERDELTESEALQEAHERINELQRRVGSQAKVRIAKGPIKRALIEDAKESDADLLIIGRRPQPNIYARARDLTLAMVRDSPYPVLSI